MDYAEALPQHILVKPDQSAGFVRVEFELECEACALSFMMSLSIRLRDDGLNLSREL